MKTSTMIGLAVGGWALWRVLAAQKAGVSVERAITNPLTPVETLKAAQTAENGTDTAGADVGLSPLRRRLLLG